MRAAGNSPAITLMIQFKRVKHATRPQFLFATRRSYSLIAFSARRAGQPKAQSASLLSVSGGLRFASAPYRPGRGPGFGGQQPSTQTAADKKMQCFLSYARENKVLADKLYIRMRQMGLSVWMDQSPAPYPNKGIPPGVDWDSFIAKQIAESDIFLPLFSSERIDPDRYFHSELIAAFT